MTEQHTLQPPTRKAQIARVAGRLFREHGYAATSMRQLAGELGVKGASLYSHITGKEELLQQLCFDLAGEFLSIVPEVEGRHADAPSRLRAAIRRHIRIITQNIDATAVFFHDWRHMEPDARERFRQLRQKYEAFFRQLVQQGVDEGSLRKIDPRIAALTLFSAMNFTYEWYRPEGRMTPEELADSIADTLLHGLLAHPQTKQQ